MLRKGMGVICSLALAWTSATQAQTSGAAIQASPQQAIDFIATTVEQYSLFACASIESPYGTRMNITDTKKSLAQVSGGQLVVQDTGKSSISGEIGVDQEDSVDTQSVSLRDVGDIVIETGAVVLACEHPRTPIPPAILVQLRCINSKSCVVSRSTIVRSGIRQKSLDLSNVRSTMTIRLNDREMAERLVKAIAFYKSAVASTPSPF